MLQPDELIPFPFVLIPAHKPEILHENIRSAVARNLPVVRVCHPHEHTLSIAGGGPSLADTYKDMTGQIAAINGSLAWLLDHGIVPALCGVCDPSPHMVDIVVADPRVSYFIASVVHPGVFDKLLAAGCHVVRWNCSSIPGGAEVLAEIEPDYLLIGGGSTMGLRWITLGYTCGFRKFHLHGMDSSFRGTATHAYPDHQDSAQFVKFGERVTKPNFIAQAADFIMWMNRMTLPDSDPVEIQVYGDGLLQDKWRDWKAAHPNVHDGVHKPSEITDKFVWPDDDVMGRIGICLDAPNIYRFMSAFEGGHRVAVQAGGNVGVYAAHLSRIYDHVLTFEPDARNYECLAHNLKTFEHKGNIAAYNAALGAGDGTVSTRRTAENNCGATRIIDGGDVPMRTIDGLGLDACDMIWLDVEGYELPILQGAEKTIAKHHPAIILEEGDRALIHGLEINGARQWLEERGYKAGVKYGLDRMFLPPPPPATVASERAKYVKVWGTVPNYRARSPGERLVPLAVERMGFADGDSIIDFGCGTGRAAVELAKLGYDVVGVDIAQNCLDPGTLRWIRFVEACLWTLPEDIGADWGFCTDTLEHLPPQYVEETLRRIHAATDKGVFFQVAFNDDTWARETGEQLHMTIRPVDWWLNELSKHWPDLQLIWPVEAEIGLRGVITAKV